MNWTLGFAALICLVVGLVGQAFEMRRIRQTQYFEDEIGSPSIFADRRNFKWYGVIGAGVVLWYAAERM